jgi:hypothetical protein
MILLFAFLCSSLAENSDDSEDVIALDGNSVREKLLDCW